MKFFLSLAGTLALIYTLNRSWVIDGNRVPPLGRFLDPLQGFWQNAEAVDSEMPPELSLTGLQGAVTVLYDSLLIPHIFASAGEDLYLAQGYVTARHRLWQMEFQTHATAGRLASILGPGPDSVILDRDRSQRRLGLVYAAHRSLEQMLAAPATKMMIEQYTEGVNQYIRSLRYKDLPLEYKLLDYYPEDWTPLKCAILVKSMAQTLNMGDKDLQMTNALHLFGPDTVALLYPDREPGVDPVVDKPGGWNFNAVTLDTVPPALPDELIRISGLQVPEPGIGSNNWAVSGRKSATGAPMLCSDPHLDTTLPSLWFAVQLHAPGVNTMGVSLPGAPCVVIGFTDSVAWGITNAQRDLVDWYKITYRDASRKEYLLDSQWVETHKELETIEVRDGPAFYDTVVYTHWGPVPYDDTFRAASDEYNYAFRWISHDPSNEMMTFYELNRARNYDDYMAALDHFAAPAQNFVFASASGDIAMRVQGKFPVRRQYEGKFALDGSRRHNGWQAFIPFDQNVTDKNPERGFVSSANQYPADATYPYYITATNYEAFRNRRINNVLRSGDRLTVQDMMTLQNDNYSLKAEESVPALLAMLDSASLSPAEAVAYRTLRSWDYVYATGSESAPYYEAWWENLMRLTWDELSRDDLSLAWPTAFTTTRLLKEQPGLSFFDIKETPEKETARDVVRQAFAQAVNDITRWQDEHHQPARWADYKDTYIRHLARLEPFSYHVQHGGTGSTVNASKRLHGPSWRMIVSLEPAGVQAFAVYPGGQSGNPGSAWYSNMIDAWSRGAYFRLHFINAVDDPAFQPLFHTTLAPARP